MHSEQTYVNFYTVHLMFFRMIDAPVDPLLTAIVLAHHRN